MKVTKPKTISIKPLWFDTRKYQDKFKLTPLHWYWELMIRKSYLDQIKAGMDIGEPLKKLRNKTFATLGKNPIILDLQLKSILKKDIWSERGYKSHSARLTTCMDVFKLDIREDIEKECQSSTDRDEFGLIYEIPVEDSELMHNTPVDLQYDLSGLDDIDEVREAHLTIDLAAPNSVLKEDIWKIVETLKKDYGNQAEIITSKKRNWSASNVLEHVDLFLAEVEQGKDFKPSERAKWIPPLLDSKDQSKASTHEKKAALKLLNDEVLHQLYIEIYSAGQRDDLDRCQ